MGSKRIERTSAVRLLNIIFLLLFVCHDVVTCVGHENIFISAQFHLLSLVSRGISLSGLVLNVDRQLTR
jgi:hypothetical protein